MILHRSDAQEQEVVLLEGNRVVKRSTSADSFSRLGVEQSCYERLGSHPFIAIMVGYKEGELMLEFCSNKDLIEYAGTFPDCMIPEAEARVFCYQIASAMAYCHYCKITHRDLKLENVFLDANKQVRLGDFGFAQPFTRYNQKFPRAGTLEYHSPEHFLGFTTPRTDMWCFGILMFELLAGYLPFENSDTARDSYEWPLEPVPLIDKLLSVNPNHRPLFKYILLDPWFDVSR